MQVTAIRNFLLNGQHVAIGTVLDMESSSASAMLAAKRVIVAPAAEEIKKPVKGAKK